MFGVKHLKDGFCFFSCVPFNFTTPQESDTFPKTNKFAPENRPYTPHKRKPNRLPSINFQVLEMLVSGRDPSVKFRTPGHLCDHQPPPHWCNLRSPNPKTFRVSSHRWHLREGIIHTKPFDAPVDGTQRNPN